MIQGGQIFMHVSFDKVVPEQVPNQLPIRFEQSTSRASIVLRLLLLVPALVIVAVPLTLLAAHAVAEPAALHFLAEHPLTTVQISLAIAICALLFVRPLQRLLVRAGAKRQVEIAAGTVRVTDWGPLRTRAWSEALSGYRGVAHHVRTTLSGMRQEMILVHPDPARHVLLAVGDNISKETLARTAALFNLPEVHARELYGFERWRPLHAPITPEAPLAPAQA